MYLQLFTVFIAITFDSCDLKKKKVLCSSFGFIYRHVQKKCCYIGQIVVYSHEILYVILYIFTVYQFMLYKK